jgi:hypothetical protein
MTVSAIPYEGSEEQWDQEEQDTFVPTRRPGRKLFGRGSAVLIALVLGVAGFYVGVHVEKGQVSSSTSSSVSLPSLATSATARSGASSTGAGARSGFPASAGLGAGNASIGTVSNVKGKTLYMSDTSGNTIKVKLSSATKITKSLAVGRQSVHPGDSVVIQGAKAANGTVHATSVSDSGTSTTSSTSGTSASSSGTSGSGVSSLFSTGGGG